MVDELTTSLVQKPRANSVVWDYFGLKTNDNGSVIVSEEQRPVCRTCYKSISKAFPLYNDHTGQNIAEAFQDVLANWNISMSRITSSTTDNGSNFVAAFTSIDCEWLSCFGHNLNLAVSKALQIDRVQRCVRKCHSLIEVFSRS